MSMPADPDCRNQPEARASALASAIRGGVAAERFAHQVQAIGERVKPAVAKVKPGSKEKRRKNLGKRIRKAVRKLLRKLGLARP